MKNKQITTDPCLGNEKFIKNLYKLELTIYFSENIFSMIAMSQTQTLSKISKRQTKTPNENSKINQNTENG